MKNSIDISGSAFTSSDTRVAENLAAKLDTDGIVLLPDLVSTETLNQMQHAFDTRLRRVRWNNFEGYQRTEQFRHMVEDVLLLDQGFVDAVLSTTFSDLGTPTFNLGKLQTSNSEVLQQANFQGGCANKITLLQTKPLGVKSAINPILASGAADPE